MAHELHLPVMLEECLAYLQPQPGAVIVDATVGLGGHSARILAALGETGRLIGLDRDAQAIQRARERLEVATRGATVSLVHANYRDLSSALGGLGITPIDGCLVDLGVSSMQLDVPGRGFSFRQAGPLDMRMDPDAPLTAAQLLAECPEGELARILWEYGEERYSRRIARRVVERRGSRPITDTLELAELIRACYPAEERRGRIHPATRSFQALRIAVNDELTAIEPFMEQAVSLLRPGGRLVMLTYHSLEDRIVKQAFLRFAGRCICPPELPLCACNASERARVVTRKPVTPSPQEVERNPRARSARLRALERLPAS